MKKLINDNYNDDKFSSYREALERLKIEFGDFIRLCEAARTVRYAALKARKKSISLRKLLKDFRNVSLENDARIIEIMENAKEQIKNEL